MGVYDDAPLDASTLKALKEYKKQKAKEQQAIEEIDLFVKKEINNEIPDNGWVVDEPTEDNTDDDTDDNNDIIETKKDYTEAEKKENRLYNEAKKDKNKQIEKELIEFATKKEPEPTPEPTKKIDLSRFKIKKASRVICEDDDEPKQEPKQEPISTYVDSTLADNQREKKHTEPKLVNTAPAKYDKASRMENTNALLTDENIKLKKQLEELQNKLKKEQEAHKATKEELKTMQKYESFYKKMNKLDNPVKKFLESICIFSENPLDRVKCKDLFDKYKETHNDISATQFYKLVEAEGFFRILKDGIKVFRNMQLKSV